MKKTILILFLFCFAYSNSEGNDILALQKIQMSHIQANLPDTFEEFQIILKRDLNLYFSKLYQKQVKIKHHFLRKAPTQSGVSYPKFYLWIEVLSDNNMIDSGAIRIAGINKTTIRVTDFVKKEQLNKTPEILKNIFPKALNDKILEFAN